MKCAGYNSCSRVVADSGFDARCSCPGGSSTIRLSPTRESKEPGKAASLKWFLGRACCVGMFDDNRIYIGKREGWGQQQPFSLGVPERRQHVYISGQTGTGKSTLLRNMVAQDILLGHGVGVVDPHGDLAEELLDLVPPSRTRDVVYFNPADTQYPVPFNLLGTVPEKDRHLVASGILQAFKHVWKDAWGNRMAYILHNAIAALLDCENASLLGIQRMLYDERYRDWVVRQVKNPMVRAFWVHEFAGYDKAFRTAAVAPIQNKIGQLLIGPLRNLFGQIGNAIDPRYIMDNNRIFIANLAKGRLGEHEANLIGSLLVTGFQLAAMSRSNTPEENREDFFLSLDEFHNFSTDSFAGILSEARKYRLSLTLANQYQKQLPASLRDAVFGNAGTLISFRVGEEDAQVLAGQFGGTQPYRPSHFSGLANHTVCVKLMSEGGYGEPFTGTTLPPLDLSYGRSEAIVRRCRERYGVKRVVVEERIRRWLERDL